ncbi:MAG TPA: crotonase, partial [Blastocatellia bacterium]|nr:crotonase [Blastocatellia bacterium]
EFTGQTPVSQRNTFLERSLFNSVDAFPKPVIAMINGFCLGGGNELALACDLRYCSENARFSQPEINLGIMPGGGGTQRLARLIGEGRAMEVILSGKMIDAAAAHRVGLVNDVFPADELEAKTMEIASGIAEKAPIALQMCKEAVKFASRSNLDEGLRREIDLFAICFSTEDKEEGVAAFLEKRKPVFKGK